MLNLALIGYGKWGGNYLKEVRSIKNCRIKYVCSPSIFKSNLPKTYKKVTNYRKLTEFKDLNGVIIATPSNTHFEIIKYFLEKKINILVEKPMVTSLHEAQSLKPYFKEFDLVFMVNHIYFHNSLYKLLKQNLNKAKSVQLINFSGTLSPEREDVSVLWDWGPHFASICLDLYKKLPKKIIVRERGPRSVEYQLFFEGSKQALFKGSWDGPKKIRIISFKFPQGEATLDIGNNFLLYTKRDSEKKYTSVDNTLRSVIANYINAIKEKNHLNDFKFGLKITRFLTLLERAS